MEERIWHKAYAPGVPIAIDYEKITLPAAFDRSVARFPDRTALIMMGKKISYRELADLIHRFANALDDLGMKKGRQGGPDHAQHAPDGHCRLCGSASGRRGGDEQSPLHRTRTPAPAIRFRFGDLHLHGPIGSAHPEDPGEIPRFTPSSPAIFAIICLSPSNSSSPL